MRNRESGFTIGELIVVLLLGSCVMAVAASLLVHSHGSARLLQDAATVVQEGTRTLEALERDVRCAVSVDEAGPGRLRVVTPGGPVTWEREGDHLLREEGGARAVMLRGIHSFDTVFVEGRVEATLRHGRRHGGGTPPPLFTAVTPRVGGGGR